MSPTKTNKPTDGMFTEINNRRIDRYRWAVMIRETLEPLVPEIGNISILCLKEHKRTLSIKIRTGNDRLIAKFQLSFLPGCKGIIVSHALEVSEDYRQRGIANALMAVKILMASELGAAKLIATVVKDNSVQRKLMNRHGWELLEQFKNKRTGNTVLVFDRDIS